MLFPYSGHMSPLTGWHVGVMWRWYDSNYLRNRISAIKGWRLLFIRVRPLIENLREGGFDKRVGRGKMKGHRTKGHIQKVISNRNRCFVTCDTLKFLIVNFREMDLIYEGWTMVMWRTKWPRLNIESDRRSQVLDGETNCYIIKSPIAKSRYYKGPSAYYVVPCNLIFLNNRPPFLVSPEVLFQRTI